MGTAISSNKIILTKWVKEALIENKGSGNVIEIAKIIWKNHEEDLKTSGDLFFTWQYDYRWAATHLRQKGILRSANDSPRGVWELEYKFLE